MVIASEQDEIGFVFIDCFAVVEFIVDEFDGAIGVDEYLWGEVFADEFCEFFGFETVDEVFYGKFSYIADSR